MSVTARIIFVAISTLLTSCVSVNGMALPSDDGYINLANPPVDEPCVDCEGYDDPFKCEYVECVQIEDCVIPKGECCPQCERVGKFCEVDGVVIPSRTIARFPNDTVCICENALDTEVNTVLLADCFQDVPIQPVEYEEYNWFGDVPYSDTCGTVDGFSLKNMGEPLSLPDGRQCWCDFGFDGYTLKCSPPTSSLVKSNSKTLLETPQEKPSETALDTPSETPLETPPATPQGTPADNNNLRHQN